MWGTRDGDAALNQLADEIRELTKEVASLQGERDAQVGLRSLTDERNTLTREVERLGIEKERLEEGFKRERREIEHMVGLEKQRAAQEAELGVRGAALKVQEEAVTDQVKVIKKELEITTKAFGEQIAYLKDDIIGKVFRLVPEVSVNKTIRTTEKA